MPHQGILNLEIIVRSIRIGCQEPRVCKSLMSVCLFFLFDFRNYYTEVSILQTESLKHYYVPRDKFNAFEEVQRLIDDGVEVVHAEATLLLVRTLVSTNVRRYWKVLTIKAIHLGPLLEPSAK